MPEHRTAIWWLRRDFRLRANAALSAAARAGESVLPLFIIDPHLLPLTTGSRQQFLWMVLHSFADEIMALGGRLLVRIGEPLAVLTELSGELGGAPIFAQADVSPFARTRDERIRRLLPLELTQGVTAIPPEMVVKSNGEPFRVFTPFSTAWKNLPPPTADFNLPSIHWADTAGLRCNPIPPVMRHFTLVHENEALAQLRAFTTQGIYQYAEQRNFMAQEGTSRLSAALHFGLISAAQAYALARQAQAQTEEPQPQTGCETWINELIWREFYAAVLYHFPFVRRMAFREQYRNLPWRNAPQDLLAWQKGETGYPIVDAAMRQLNTTGWMHNRARMIAASFLVKDLNINWQEGEAYFLQQLMDGDIASNNGGWQWTAGVGTDAAPYVRIFNPVSQSIKFDPRGEYIRRWLPELAHLPDEVIHAPWTMPASQAQEFGFRLDEHYPSPIVDHAEARQRTLSLYGKRSESPQMPF